MERRQQHLLPLNCFAPGPSLQGVPAIGGKPGGPGINRIVHIADASDKPLSSLHIPPVDVPAVPCERVSKIRFRRIVGGREKVAGDRDFQLDAFEAGGNGVPAHVDLEDHLMARDPLAGVIEAERGPRNGNTLPKHLVLALHNRATGPAGIFTGFFLGRGLLRRLGVRRQPQRPVLIPRAEMGDGDTPEGLAG